MSTSEQGSLTLSPLLGQLRPYLAREPQLVYLVGGAVRDAVLNSISHDLDFVVQHGATKLAFRIGDALAAPAYVLDSERDTGRVVLSEDGTMLDFSCFRGPDLEADLRDRDFTINALALPATAETLEDIIDFSGGLRDLEARRLHIIHAGSLEHDPVRCLRAVRLASDLQFHMSVETRDAVVAAAPLVANASVERVRDELLKMLRNRDRATAVGELSTLGLLPVVLPEIAALEEVPQSPPHHEPVLAHTIRVLRRLETLDNALFEPSMAEQDAALSAAARALAPYVPALQEHLQRPLDGGLDGRHVLYLAALFHDVGKKETMSVGDDGRYHFFGHDEAGARLAGSRLRALSLSNEVIMQVKTIVAEHMRPLLLAQAQGQKPSRRAVYRFFQAAHANGLDVGLLALADHLATYDGPGTAEDWDTLLGLVAALFGHYFEQYTDTVQPPPLLNGRELMDALDLVPGPEVGRLLRLIEESQAAGELITRDDALRFAAEQKT
jgi:tRNA nucleotidyltransferase/poly(A) polymerase